MANPNGHIEINAVQYDFVKLLSLKSYAHVEAVATNVCVLIKDCREIPPGSEPLAVEVTKPDGKKEYLVFAKNPTQLADLTKDNTKMVKLRIYSKFGLKKAKPENATVEPSYEPERPRYSEGRHEGRYQGGGYQGNNYQGGYQSQGYQGNRPRIVNPENQGNRSEPYRPAGTFQQHPSRDQPQRTGPGQSPDPRGGSLLNRPRN